ncbi:hypothetical protein Tco_0427912, partial [Tanacetum coccineum]
VDHYRFMDTGSAEDDGLWVGLFDPSKKKKKKVVIQDPADNVAEQLTEKSWSEKELILLDTFFLQMPRSLESEIFVFLDPIREDWLAEGIVLEQPQGLSWEGTDTE